MDEPSPYLPGYRDREESRFYQARGLSPEQTWQALSRACSCPASNAPALRRHEPVRYPKNMDNGSQHTPDRAQVVRGDRLVDATPEEVAESAMLLSQGAHRAIEMKREASKAARPAASSPAGRAA
jgi:hypothetical protein